MKKLLLASLVAGAMAFAQETAAQSQQTSSHSTTIHSDGTTTSHAARSESTTVVNHDAMPAVTPVAPATVQQRTVTRHSSTRYHRRTPTGAVHESESHSSTSTSTTTNP